jgi:uncharacterized protein HemY
MFRDPQRSVELARKAVEQVPEDGSYWDTLGVAFYRAGKWQDAIDALQKSEELLPGEVLSSNAFFLAMAHWQLDQKEEARQWYDRAAEWMDHNRTQDEELQQFRAEVEDLLGVKEQKQP